MGSSGMLTDSETIAVLDKEEREFHEYAYRVYMRRVDAGVALEQARKDMPQSVYCLVDWTLDLHNLLNLLVQRTNEHAQLETQQYARAMLEIADAWVPITMEAWRDYRLNSMRLSHPEQVTLANAVSSGALVGGTPEVTDVVGWMRSHVKIHARMKSREIKQLYRKMRKLIPTPPAR